MNYRDPNVLYRTNEVVGKFSSAVVGDGRVILNGTVDRSAIETYRLDQVVVLDGANRFVQGGAINNDGEWVVEASNRDIGFDNAALEISVYSVSHTNNFIFALESDPSAVKQFRQFVSARLPENSKDVPSLKHELRELIIKETQKPYVSRSIRDAISTGNNYQTLALENTLRQGGRQSRERFLFQIDFRGKSVLDIGANTGENSRIVRRLGAGLVDGYEYDPYFVETGRAVNALTGMTRVSLFQGDCTRPELFNGMKYDVVLALSVWVYLKETIKDVTAITDVMVFETHTLDHGIEAYYKPITKYFPHAVSLGYSDLPKDPHKSRMFIVFGKTKEGIESLLRRRFLKVEPYFNNRFIKNYQNLSKPEIKALCQECFEKHVGRTEYSEKDYRFASDAYFELFLAGLYQFWDNEGKVEGLVGEDNLYLKYLRESIHSSQIDQNLRDLLDNPDWMIRKISNKYEDAFNIINGHVDRVAPVEVSVDEGGKLSFVTSEGEAIKANNIDGHHRFFVCQLVGVEKIHFTVSGQSAENLFPNLFERSINTNYTLSVK